MNIINFPQALGFLTPRFTTVEDKCQISRKLLYPEAATCCVLITPLLICISKKDACKPWKLFHSRRHSLPTQNHLACFAEPSITSRCFKYLVPFLSTGPHFQNTQGIGIIATVMKANRLAAEANPSLSIICTVKGGSWRRR